MISVVVVTFNNAGELVGALAPLVPGSIDGLVRELVVADGGSTDATLEIADEAGATVVRGGRGEGVAAAREPWVLWITPQSRLTFGWLEQAKDHIARFPDRPAVFARHGLFAKVEAQLIPKAQADRAAFGRRPRKLRL